MISVCFKWRQIWEINSCLIKCKNENMTIECSWLGYMLMWIILIRNVILSLMCINNGICWGKGELCERSVGV